MDYLQSSYSDAGKKKKTASPSHSDSSRSEERLPQNCILPRPLLLLKMYIHIYVSSYNGHLFSQDIAKKPVATTPRIVEIGSATQLLGKEKDK
jgi:hypothetical protein